MEETTLEKLIGKHTLSGVDEVVERIEQYSDYYEDCEVIRFVLDGKTYTASQDPEDGYRSSMKEIMVSDDKVINTFPPVEVIGKMQHDDYSFNDVLELYNINTGKLILAVGTENYDDYYPCWVADFNPEAM